MMRSKADLPAPFGPKITDISPGFATNVSRRRTEIGPKFLTKSTATIPCVSGLGKSVLGELAEVLDLLNGCKKSGLSHEQK